MSQADSAPDCPNNPKLQIYVGNFSYSLCNLSVSIFWNIFYNRLFTRIQCFCEIALLTYLPWSIWKRMLISAAQSLLTLKQFIIWIFRLHMDFLIDCPGVREQKVTIWTRLHKSLFIRQCTKFLGQEVANCSSQPPSVYDQHYFDHHN